MKDLIEKSDLMYLPGWSWKVIVVFLCSLFVLCAGTYKLEEISITNDEATTIFIASHDSIPSVIKSERDTYPPLYYILVHLFLQISPEKQIFMVRLFSLILGVLCIPLFFILLCKIAPSYNPLPAIALLTASELLIYFSREGRCYTLVLFLSLISGLILIRIFERDDFRGWCLYIVVSLCLFYTHFFTAFFLFSQALFIFAVCLIERRRVLIKHFILSTLIIIVFILPLVMDIITHAALPRGLSSGPDYDFKYLKYIILTLTFDWRKLQFIYLVLYFIGLWRCFIEDKKLFFLNSIIFFLPLILSPAFFKMVGNSYFRMKYLIYVLPYFLIPVSMGFLYLRKHAILKTGKTFFINGASIVFFLVVMCVMLTDLKLYTLNNYFNNKTHTNWKLASRFLNFNVASDDGIGFYPDFIQKIYHIYSSIEADTYLFGSAQWMPETDIYQVQAISPHTLNQGVFESIFKGYRRFWMVTVREYEFLDFGKIRKFFCRYFLEKELYSVGRIKIFIYQRRI